MLSLRALLSLVAALLVGLAGAGPALAQSTDDDDDDVETAPGGDDDEIRLRAPAFEPIAGSGAGGEEDEEDEEGEEDYEEEDVDEEEDAEEEDSPADDETLPDPTAADRRLDLSTADPTVEPWTTPQTVFEVHGYMRMRGEFQDQFSTGRGGYPFSLFIPREDGQVQGVGNAPEGGCAGAQRLPDGTWRGNPGDAMNPAAACNQRALAYANMRLRIEPTLHLSDDVRVRMQLDLLDNLVMGSTPDGYYYSPESGRAGSSYVPLLALSDTQVPPRYGYNSWQDSIVVRRAWAEVRNRGLGELRFGRMGNHWGLGMLWNGGAGIDSDFQSDVDRIMAITRLVGFYFFGAWDFAAEGYIYDDPAQARVPFDASRMDDVDQFTFGVARRSTPEEQAAALQRGDAVLNAGLYFVYRTQNLTTEGFRTPLQAVDQPNSVLYVRRGFETYTPDVWVQFLYENLRLEVEAAMVIGTIDNLFYTDSGFNHGRFEVTNPTNNVLSFGIAFEGEYHLLNNQLGIYFNAGFASGDADVEGLTAGSAPRGLQYQEARADPTRPRDTNLTAFGFHPNYRVDLIFWRTIMRGIGSGYYFRPGLSYDFIRSSFGQLLGARADVVWSRAAEPLQTWGNTPDLAVEIDASVYYRSEDGPDLLDGFYASLHYGIMFPLAGLGYLPNAVPANEQFFAGGSNAQTLRLVLGVQY